MMNIKTFLILLPLILSLVDLDLFMILWCVYILFSLLALWFAFKK